MACKKRILCIGAGYVGGPTMAVIADKCPQHTVTIVDINEDRIGEWNSDELPIYEPGLDEIVKRNRGRNLFFSTDIPAGIRDSDIIFVSVNTPTKTFGLGAGYAADLQYWEKTARQILEHASSDKIVVEKSTLPVRTAEAMARILCSNGGSVKFDVLSNPEFLAEGTAVRDLLEPDRVLVGCLDTASGRAACEELVGIYENWVDPARIIRTNVWSAELAKLVANAFLAQRISSINSISALCEKTAANIGEVARAIGFDARIGARFLNAGVGFGGSCFKKDIFNLVYICRQHGLDEVADYWEQVVRINEYQQDRFAADMVATMFNTVAGKKIAIFGFAFKANTGDTRESPAIRVCHRLREERAILRVTDPRALPNARRDLAGMEDVSFFEDPYEAAADTHAIAVLTEWDLYRTLDYGRIYEMMVKPAYIFDGRNVLDHAALGSIGFNVHAIGIPPGDRV